MKLAPAALPIVLSLLSACGSDSSQNTNKYANDQLVVVTTGSFTFSTGQSDSYEKETVKTYTEVDSIPDKYKYSGDIAGPFKLEVSTEDGVIEGHEYNSATGTEIIDDNFEEFESIDFTVKQGTEASGDIQFGDSYNYYENATLFDSTSGLELGYKITEMTMEFISIESVTVLAGTFDAVKISFDGIYEVDKGSEQQLANMSGNIWMDTEHGYSLKSTMVGTFNYPHLSTSADAVVSTELKYVHIEEDIDEGADRSRKLPLGPTKINLKRIANEVISSML